MDALVSAARGIVIDGVRDSGVPLSQVLEHHLATTLARFMTQPLDPRALTYRLTQAMEAEAEAPVARAIGDECLICCGFFSARLRRQGGSVRHYAGVGQTAYEAAGLTEAALGFPHMIDVLIAVRCGSAADGGALLDLARAGSTRARQALEDGNVVLFRR